MQEMELIILWKMKAAGVNILTSSGMGNIAVLILVIFREDCQDHCYFNVHFWKQANNSCDKKTGFQNILEL